MSKLKFEQELWLIKHDSADEVVEDITTNSANYEKALIPKKATK